MSEQRGNVWAPWRMEYIASINEQDQACFLCAAHATPARDVEDYILWRTRHAIVILNRFPYSSGHTLIAPARHAAQPEDLTDDELLELMRQARDVKRVIEHAMRAQGFNIGINLGRCAGAGLPGHLHLHVVPRWGGDTNYMAVLSDTKVIPQALAATRTLLLDSARELALPGLDG